MGDASFQKKCLGKMEDAAEREGRTVLFVSHNMSAIKSLCNIGIILSAGRLYKHTTIGEATQAYEMVDFSCSRVYSASFIETGKFPGDHQIRLIRASIEQNQMVGPFAHDDPIDIRIEVECGDNARLKRVSVVIIDSSGIAILHTDNALSRGQDKHLNRGRNHLLFHIPPGI